MVTENGSIFGVSLTLLFFARPSKFEDNNLCHLIVAKEKIKFHHHSLEGLMILVASFAADGK